LRAFFYLMCVLLAGCAKPKRELNLFIWSEYIDPKVVAQFEKQFDCKVRIDLYENSDGMMSKLSAGGDSIYDVIVPNHRTLPILAKSGLLAPLRQENIPNLTNISSQFANPAFDAGNRYGAPYLWDMTGLYVREPKGTRLEETWGLIFDPAKQPGPFLLMDDIRATLGAALRYKGHSLNSTNRADLLEARDVLVQAKKRSLGFEGHTGSKNRVLSRGATAAITYREVRGQKEDPETRFFIPKEGSALGLDLLAIPARAHHRDLAEKFINYILEPKVSAQIADWIGTATANAAALQFIDPSDRTNQVLYPPPEVMRRLEFTQDLGPQNRLYDEVWTEIKSR
jgi:spermidine/putrescine transport system substrate-binding protein